MQAPGRRPPAGGGGLRLNIVGVLLAAGGARRFGGGKLLARLADGTPLAVAAARNLVAALPDSLAVIAPGDPVLAGVLQGAGLRLVINPEAGRGMGRSIARGVASAAHAGGWLIALGDMPRVRPATIAALAAALDGPEAIAAPFHDGRRGNPVAFGAGWRAALCALDGDQGARALLQSHPLALRRVDLDDPGIFLDVDLPADLKRV